MEEIQTQTARLVRFIREEGVIRSRDLARLGIRRQTLARVCQRGIVERCGRGTYRLPESAADEHSSLVAACKRIPKGVVCLLSALWFHGLISEQPKQVWIAVDRKARLPRIDRPPIKVVRFSGKAMTQGLVNLKLNGTAIRVFSPMKTVADCFKYRSKVGIQIGTAVLKSAIEQNKYNRQKLLRFAQICRVKKVAAAAASDAERDAKHAAEDTLPNHARTWESESLREQVWTEPLRQIARRLGISDVALAKRCKKLKIPVPGRGYWSRKPRTAIR